MKKVWIMSLLLGVALINSAQAATINLGQASSYNAFIKENFTANTSDTRGKMAVGGNLIIEPGNGGQGGYSVGLTADGKGPSLVVGGDIIKTGSNGWLVVNKNGNNVGDAVYAGKLDVFVNEWGTQLISANTTKVSVANLPVDFNAAFQHLNNLSAQLATQTTAATKAASDAHVLTFTPAKTTSDNVYVFNLTQEDFNRYGGFNVQGVNSDALIVFNISNPNKIASQFGETDPDAGFCKKGEANCVVFSQKSVYLNGVNASKGTSNLTAPLASQILYNFKDVSRLKIASDVYGSVLAPKAAIETSASVVWGQVMAKSWTGNSEIDPAPLKQPTGTKPPAVSEPSMWLALLVIFAGFLVNRRHANNVWRPQVAFTTA